MTSAGSAELIAVSSLFTYDGWWHYVRPQAKSNELLWVTKVMILIYTACMGKHLYHVLSEAQAQITLEQLL